VFDEWLAVAVESAALQFGVEGVEDVGIDCSDSGRAEQRQDVVVEAAAVAAGGGLLEVCELEVAGDENLTVGLVRGCRCFVDLYRGRRSTLAASRSPPVSLPGPFP
jgi:hypothetical protein